MCRYFVIHCFHDVCKDMRVQCFSIEYAAIVNVSVSAIQCFSKPIIIMAIAWQDHSLHSATNTMLGFGPKLLPRIPVQGKNNSRGIVDLCDNSVNFGKKSQL